MAVTVIFRGAVILINRLGLFYESKHTYIGYTVGFSEEARWCCFPPLPPSLCLSLPLPLQSTVILFSLFPLPLLLGAISDLFGEGRVPWVSLSKKERKEDTFPHNLHRELNRSWQIILASHYLRKRSSQFLSKLTSAFFLPTSSK